MKITKSKTCIPLCSLLSCTMLSSCKELDTLLKSIFGLKIVNKLANLWPEENNKTKRVSKNKPNKCDEVQLHNKSKVKIHTSSVWKA